MPSPHAIAKALLSGEKARCSTGPFGRPSPVSVRISLASLKLGDPRAKIRNASAPTNRAALGASESSPAGSLILLHQQLEFPAVGGVWLMTGLGNLDGPIVP